MKRGRNNSEAVQNKNQNKKGTAELYKNKKKKRERERERERWLTQITQITQKENFDGMSFNWSEES